MPIINGQKMACAPCIRGHRSTKCNHFNERVMVPVRKPGRPLSTCPCPPGKPCACGGVKVAIPRKQQCGCGPENGKAASPVEQERTPTETPTSPSRPSFRVNKSGSSSRVNGRKQSFDPTNLSRIDPMSVNIITPQNRSLDMNGGTIPDLGAQMPPPSTSAYMPNISYVSSGPPNGFPPHQELAYSSPLSYSMDSQYSHSQHLQHVVKREDSFPSPHIHNNGLSIQTTSVTNGTKSCCAPAVEEPLPKVDLRPALMPSNGVSTGGSCCSKKESPVLGPTGVPTSQPGYMPQFQAPIDLKHQNFQPPIQFPTVYTYPGDYGSWQHPVDQAIWQQIAAQPSLPMGNAMSTPTNGTVSGDVGTTHECACVDCKCVGCLAHPFNDQMFQYVNHAYMESPTGTNGHATIADLASQTTQANSSNSAPGSASGSGSAAGNGNGASTTAAPGSPPDAQTPSDASGFSDEQSLSTVDYFFVNLPLRMDGTCGGDLHACPCGDDCQCIGCLVHNNPVPLE